MTKRSAVTIMSSVGSILLVALSLTIAVAALPGCKKAEEIKIGAILPLTGDAAIYGQWSKKGIDLAVEEIDKEGGIKGRKIKIIYEDDQCGPQPSVAAMNKLIDVDKVQVVIGALCSSASLAVAPIANDRKVVLFSPGSSSPLLTQAGPYFFRNWPSDVYEGECMADFTFEQLKLKKVAVLFINNEYGTGLKNVFVDRFDSLGGEIVLIESYEQGASDFHTQLTKVKNFGAEGIYVPGHTKELGQVLKQMHELGIKIPFMSVVGFESPQTLSIAGQAAEGAFYTAPAFDPTDESEIVRKFVNAYKAKYDETPENFAAHGYDAVKILALAIERVGYSSDAIRDELYKIQDFPGVSGRTSFDSNGDVEKPAMIKTVRDGQFVRYEEQ